MIKTSTVDVMYTDDVVLPIESIGVCLRTIPLYTFYIVPTKLPLVIRHVDNLTKQERRDCLKSYKSKPKKIRMATHVSHMLVDEDKNIINQTKPVTLANGYCENCWDMGLGGNIPPNAYQWKALRKTRAKKKEHYD